MCRLLNRGQCISEVNLLIIVGLMTFRSGTFKRSDFIDALVYYEVPFTLWRTFQTLLNYETFFVPPYPSAGEQSTSQADQSPPQKDHSQS